MDAPRCPMLLRAPMGSVLVACGLPLSAAAQGTTVPSDSLLAGITARGRLLAAYDQAAWHATDALLALRPDSAVVQAANTMIATLQPDGRWTVRFGRLTPASDTFYVAYEALATARPDSFAIQPHAPPLPLVGPERLAATALQVALRDFGAHQRRYNSYVLPRADGTFWVYFMPAQTDPAALPHGADIRYLMAADASRIVDKHPMHRTLLNLALPENAVSGLHTVVVDDVPQDSDVFLVLARHPRRPEMIGTEHYDYAIAIDGSITWRVGERHSHR